MYKRLIFIAAIVIFTTSCSHKTWQITSMTSTKIPIDSNTNVIADKNYESYLQSFKQHIDGEMNGIIGQAAEVMSAHGPESLLSNYCADAYRSGASEILAQQVDVAVINLGGLRTTIPAGNVTVRKIYELMPFENELVIVWLRGNKLNDLFQYFAGMGGEGVSGLRMEFRNKQAVNISINRQPLDATKLYTIATNDYLADGNDKMIPLTQSEKRLNTGIKVRDMLLNYIKTETGKGNKIQSKLDGRITIH